MIRIALVAFGALSLVESVTLGSAAAGGLGGNGGGCGGFGSLGTAVGAGVGCAGPSAKTTSAPQGDPKGNGGGPGDTWKPADNDWGYVTCPNPTGPNMPAALQEYGPNGKPIGTLVVVCPQQALPKPGVPPPPPPTPAEVWAQIPLPPPAVGINPATVGITQLSSWFWVTGDTGPVTVTVNLGGYSVTTTATPVAYQWDFGDGASAASPGAGAETNPSVTHTFHDKGTYVVTLSIDYAGTYSYAGPGGTGTATLGEYEPPGVSTPYVVQEVRSVLTPSGQV